MGSAPASVSFIVRGERVPGLKLGFAIEDAMRASGVEPILAREWLAPQEDTDPGRPSTPPEPASGEAA